MATERQTFKIILDNARQRILTKLSTQELINLTDKSFEKLFADTLKEIYEGEVSHKEGGHTFPDIQCGKFGAEIKTTNSDKWSSLGNSIMEGTRANEVEEIFVVFLKKGGSPDIRIREYDKVVSDIKVTHSPRYSIDMELDDDKSIFAELGVSYDDFRNDENKISRLKNYYREKGEVTWWMNKETGESSTNMGVVAYDTLSKIEKYEYMVELYALYPEILESDYTSPSVYLITRYGIHDKSFRDKFSAGGTDMVNFQGREEQVSKNISKLLSMIKDVVEYLHTNPNIVREEWDTTEKDIVDLWFIKCDFCLSKENKLKKPSFSIREYYENIIDNS